MQKHDPNKLFDFIKLMFNKNEYDKIPNHTKSKHFFMINRFCAIKFPIQANHLQHLNINPSEVIDYWQKTLSNLYSKTPNWMYIKSKAKRQKIKDKYISEEVLKKYCNEFNTNKREVNDAIEIFGDKMIEELKNYEKIIKSNS